MQERSLMGNNRRSQKDLAKNQMQQAQILPEQLKSNIQ
jgi:hypothetical protein